MTSEAFTDILCASSATVIVSGTATSRTTASTGIGVAAAPLESSCRSCLRLPRGPRQPPAPPDVSPRVFSRRFFCCSSDQLEASLPDLISLTPGFFSSFFAPGLASVFAAGLCNVPSGAASGAFAAFFGAAIIVLMAATSSSTTRLARCWASAACFATSSASFLRALGLHQLFGGLGLPGLHCLQVFLLFLLGIGQIALRPIRRLFACRLLSAA